MTISNEVKAAYIALPTEALTNLLVATAPYTKSDEIVKEVFDILSAEFAYRTLKNDLVTVNQRIDVIATKRKAVLADLRGMSRQALVTRLGRSMRIHSVTQSTAVSEIRYAILDAEAPYGRLFSQQELLKAKLDAATLKG